MLDQVKKAELLQILQDLIRLDSSNPPGDETSVAEYIVSLLTREGITARVYSRAPNRPNVYAELGDGQQPPVLLLSHIDVVPAPGQWKHPPFEAVNDNGTIYGRGTVDTKHLTAMEIVSMIWLKRSGFPLDRKIILLATADEENGSTFGMEFISQEHPELIPAGYVISEGGGFVLKQGEQKFRTCTCGEKGRCTIEIRPDMAKSAGTGPWNTGAGRLLQAMEAIAEYVPEPSITAPTEAFSRVVNGKFEDQTLKNLWEYSSKSCLAIDAYDFDFSKPSQEYSLSLTYQYIDGTTEADIRKMIDDIFGKQAVTCRLGKLSEGYTCDLDNPFFQKLCQVTEELDPGTKVLPIIALGRTDGRFIRNNVYGYSPLLDDMPLSAVLKMVHQCNERITEASLYFGAEVIYEAIVQTVQAAL